MSMEIPQLLNSHFLVFKFRLEFEQRKDNLTMSIENNETSHINEEYLNSLDASALEAVVGGMESPNSPGSPTAHVSNTSLLTSHPNAGSITGMPQSPKAAAYNSQTALAERASTDKAARGAELGLPDTT